MKISIQRVLLTTAMMLTLSACGTGMPVLPDEPGNEPVATTPENNNQSQETAGEISQPSILSPEAPPPPLSERQAILKMDDYVDPTHLVPDTKLEDAIVYYHTNEATLKNTAVLTVLDFSQSSTTEKTLYYQHEHGQRVEYPRGPWQGFNDSNHDGFAESRRKK